MDDYDEDLNDDGFDEGEMDYFEDEPSDNDFDVEDEEEEDNNTDEEVEKDKGVWKPDLIKPQVGYCRYCGAEVIVDDLPDLISEDAFEDFGICLNCQWGIFMDNGGQFSERNFKFIGCMDIWSI